MAIHIKIRSSIFRKEGVGIEIAVVLRDLVFIYTHLHLTVSCPLLDCFVVYVVNFMKIDIRFLGQFCRYCTAICVTGLQFDMFFPILLKWPERYVTM